MKPVPDATSEPERSSRRFLRLFLVALLWGGVAFAAGIGVARYGGIFPPSSEPALPQPSVDLTPVQAQLDRMETLLTELSHRIPQPTEGAAVQPSPPPLSLSLLGSLDFSGKEASPEKTDLVLVRDIVDDLLFFFASQTLTPRDVDALSLLIQNIFPEKKTDDLAILRSSYTHFVNQAQGLALLPEPIVAPADATTASTPSFWGALLSHFVTVRAPGEISPYDASGVPEVVSAYNDAYDAWQNTILPALRAGHLDDVSRGLEGLDAQALFADDRRWQVWKQDFDAWFRSYSFLRSARMDMTRRMIQDVSEHLSRVVPPTSPPSLPVQNPSEGAP
jgi:hypothetical protein